MLIETKVWYSRAYSLITIETVMLADDRAVLMAGNPWPLESLDAAGIAKRKFLYPTSGPPLAEVLWW